MKFKGKESPDEIISVLGEGLELSGEISFTHGVRVDGAVRGSVRSEATLLIGPQGRVEAQVQIRRVSISGEFRGSIHASERVEIHKDGKVYGDLFTPCLIIEAGAVFEGKCNMHSEEELAQKPEEDSALKILGHGSEGGASTPHQGESEHSWQTKSV